jgi:hypothetical protein
MIIYFFGSFTLRNKINSIRIVLYADGMPGSIRAALETVVEITDMRHIPRSDISSMIIELEADMRGDGGSGWMMRDKAK